MSRRRIVSLLLATALSAAGLTAATAQAAPTVNGSVAKTYIVPTRDAQIYLAVVHPTSGGTIVKSPAILTYSPYSVLGRNGDASRWTTKGIARMYADVVGTGNSGGCYDYGGNREKRTAYDIVEWIAKQPWSTGKVGMLGGSYDGTTQFAAAVMHPPHLTTIVPQAAIVRWWDYAFSGGLRYTDSNEQFGPQGPGAVSDEGADTPLGFDFGFAIPPPVDASDSTWASRVQSTITPCDELAHTREAYTTLPNNNPFWIERDYLRLLPTVKIPVFIGGNWGDWNVKQANSWTAFHKLTGSKAARLYMGTRWAGHGTPSIGDYKTSVDDWMTHYLLGAKNGIDKRLAAVNSATADSAKTIGYSVVNEKSVRPLRLSLTSINSKSSLDVKPRTGGPTAELPWTGTGTESESLEHLDSPGHHVAFLSAALTKDIRIFGSPTLRVRVASGCDYVTLSPELVDVVSTRSTTAGGSNLATSASQLVAVTRGWLDSRYRDEGYIPRFTSPANTAFDLTITLKPTDYTFRAGHRIALVLQTEATEWAVGRPCTAPDAPVVTVSYSKGESFLILPTV